MKRDFSVVVRDGEGHAYVQRAMKYDAGGVPVMESVKDQFGNTMKVHAFDKFTPMTLRQYVIDTLANRGQKEELSIDDIGKRIKLHDRFVFSTDGVIELTVAEGTMIVEAMNKQDQAPLVIFRMKDLLDTDPEPAKPAPAPAPAEDSRSLASPSPSN